MIFCIHLATVQQSCYQSTLYHTCTFGVFLFDACMWDMSIFLILLKALHVFYEMLQVKNVESSDLSPPQ